MNQLAGPAVCGAVEHKNGLTSFIKLGLCSTGMKQAMEMKYHSAYMKALTRLGNSTCTAGFIPMVERRKACTDLLYRGMEGSTSGGGSSTSGASNDVVSIVVPRRVSVVPFSELSGASSPTTPQCDSSGLVRHSCRGILDLTIELEGIGGDGPCLIHKDPYRVQFSAEGADVPFVQEYSLAAASEGDRGGATICSQGFTSTPFSAQSRSRSRICDIMAFFSRSSCCM